MKSIICFLFGHRFDEQAFYYYWPTCEFCKKEFNQGGCTLSNIQKFGIIGYPLLRASAIFTNRYYSTKWGAGRCRNCSKWLLFRKRFKKHYCSKECWDSDVPF